MSSCQDTGVDRSQADRMAMQIYNCVTYDRTFSQSALNMLAPQTRANIQAVQTVYPGVAYSLNPSPKEVQAAMASVSNDSNKGMVPCSLIKYNGEYSTPGPYYQLANAYGPQLGSKCINFGQDLNLEYMKNHPK